MNGLKCLITITKRDFAERYIDFMKEIGVPSVNVELCRGTASESVLDLMGLEQSEKVMLTSAMRSTQKEKVKEWLVNQMLITDSGNGISLLIPFDGLGGETCKKRLAGEEPIEKTEEINVENSKYVLIVVIADKGNVELIMDAARGAGATGGSFVKAHGTGNQMSKFFGISIAEEKEITYIVSKRDDRDAIMYAIMNAEGFKTEAHGIVFSLPVEGVLGIRDLEQL